VALSARTLRLVALGIVVVAIAFTVPRFLTHTPYQRLGVRLDWSHPDGHARVLAVVGPPGDRLLRRDDRILAVDGRPFTRQAVIESRGDDARRMLARGPLVLTLERDGERRTLTVPPLHLSAWQRVRLYALPVITVIAAPLVAFLLVWRRPDLSAAWVFLLFAVLEALDTIWSQFRFVQGDPGRGLQAYVTLYNAVVMWLPAAFLHFMMVFPRPRWAGRPVVRSPWFWLVVVAYATPPAILVANALWGAAIEPLYLRFQAVAFPLGSLALIARYSRPSQPDWRPLTRERVLAMVVAVTLLLGAAFTLLADDPRMVLLFSLPAMQVFYTVLLFAWLTTPLVIAYLIANDPVFDPRRLVARSLPYALLSGVLAAIYLTVVVGSQRLFAAATGEEAIVFNVVAALVVAFAFAPLRERVQRWIDRLYGRDPMALRLALEQGGRELLRALDRDEVKWAVTTALRRGLRRGVAVEWPERGLPRLAEEVGEEDRSAIDTLLLQAGIRLENLSLQQERAAAERHAAELREAAARAELRALHAQVQPHFLFNALNTLSYLIESEPAAAQRFTERLADMLRYTVQAGDRPASLLSEEIAFVEDFLGIARERYDNPLLFEYLGPRELLSTPVPPLLLQPLVENSLKHGCVAGGRPLQLALEARSEDGWLTLVFRDDGSPGANGAPGLGVGLENLAQRVRRFGGPESTMTTSRPPGGGFAVTMRWRSGTAGAIEEAAATTGRKGAPHEPAVPPRR
jgi:hypothetical protein